MPSCRTVTLTKVTHFMHQTNSRFYPSCLIENISINSIYLLFLSVRCKELDRLTPPVRNKYDVVELTGPFVTTYKKGENTAYTSEDICKI